MEYVRPDGAKGVLNAKVVVLAAFAVQNPRLLLASATDKHPQGLGNSSGLLGRYIMTHAAGLVYGLFDEETRPYMGAFGGQLVNQDSYPKKTHGSSGALGSYQWMIAQAVKPNDLLGISTARADLFGPALHEFMRRAAHGFAGMTSVVEDLPVADNRVTLTDKTGREWGADRPAWFLTPIPNRSPCGRPRSPKERRSDRGGREGSLVRAGGGQHAYHGVGRSWARAPRNRLPTAMVSCTMFEPSWWQVPACFPPARA